MKMIITTMVISILAILIVFASVILNILTLQKYNEQREKRTHIFFNEPTPQELEIQRQMKIRAAEREADMEFAQ
jgi:hypothetical protein